MTNFLSLILTQFILAALILNITEQVIKAAKAGKTHLM